MSIKRTMLRSKNLPWLIILVFIPFIGLMICIHKQALTPNSNNYVWHKSNLQVEFLSSMDSSESTKSSNLNPIEQRFLQRLERVRRFCAGRPRQDSPYPEDNPYNYIELYDYYEANMFVCTPPKAASTTLDEFVLNKFLKPIYKGLNVTMSRVNARKRHRINGTTTFENLNKLKRMKILITREPLSRVLSCWYDKFSGLMGESRVQVSRSHTLSLLV